MSKPFVNGEKRKVFCYRCNARVDATIRRKRIRWIAELKCPHGIKVMGYTRPLDELRERKLVTQGSEIGDMKHAEKQEEAMERREREEFEKKLEESSTGKVFFQT